ncbi:leukemia inhibitory factor receptor-like isoform X2 [Haliotis rufescens]|uniref:leukemia inhibitory factor receptor-like isoform X2 n=1 Tax=Haliotis rufescens TaxID=6454 RepID=UPI00201F790E|nr:leukemia inhibitory factor receptor-like isoform X2 [Haliotis rufescens]
MDTLVVLLMTWGLSVAHICDPDCAQCKGCLLPGDLSVLVGRNLTLNCTLVDSDNGSSSDLFFTWGHQTGLSGYQHVISEDTLQLVLPVNETLAEAAVFCWHGNDTVIGSKNVTVEYPLHNVTGLRVLLDDWSNVTVSWDTGLYLHPRDISVTTAWRAASEGGWHNCSVSNTTSCFIASYTPTGNLTFNITVTNTRVGDSLSMPFTVDPEDYVKPAAVTSLDAEVLFSRRQVELRWKPEAGNRSLTFTIVTRNSTFRSSNMTTQNKMDVSDLQSNSHYTFTVTAEYHPAQDGYPSDPTTVDIILSEDGVQPDDPYVIIGSNLTLNCTLADTSEEAYFTYGNDKLLPKEYQRLIADNVLQLHMPISNTSFDGVTMMCNPMGENRRQTIVLENPLQNVTDLKILLNDWNNVTVSWDTGGYLHPWDISMTTVWRAASEEGWHNCSVSNTTSCFNASYTPTGNLTFNITVTNKKVKDSLSMPFTVDPEDYVRPAPVMALELISVTSRDVTLKWGNNTNRRNLTFTVITRSATSNMTVTTSENQITISDLRPNTKYDFSVSAMSATARHGYPGEPRTVSNSTGEDAPEAAPNVTEGSFLAHDCIDGKRNISVFIKAPPKESHNGILTNYKIRLFTNTMEKAVVLTSYMMPLCNNTGMVIVCPATTTTLLLDDLNCNVDYVISISASNAAGTSPTSSLRIPKLGDVQPPTDVISAWNGTEVTVYWTSTSPDQPYNWTVFWCQWGSTNKTCQNDIQWKTVNGTQRSARIPMKSKDRALIRFGVSMETAKGSSGLSISRCNYNYSDVPAKPDKTSFDVESKPDLALTVSWKLDRCSGQGFISVISIEHCSENSACGSVNISSEKDSHVIGNLKKDFNYTVKMRQISHTGRGGPYSDPKFGVPIDSRLAAGFIILIVFACFLGLIVFVYISSRCCRSLYKKWKASEDITMPELCERHYEVPPANHRQSFDSGRGSLTPEAAARNAQQYNAMLPTPCPRSKFNRLNSRESVPPESPPATVNEQTTVVDVEQTIGSNQQSGEGSKHTTVADVEQSGEGSKHTTVADVEQSGEGSKHTTVADVEQSGEGSKHTTVADVEQSGEGSKHTTVADVEQSGEGSRVWDESWCDTGDETNSAYDSDVLSAYVAVVQTDEEDLNEEEEEEKTEEEELQSDRNEMGLKSLSPPPAVFTNPSFPSLHVGLKQGCGDPGNEYYCTKL